MRNTHPELEIHYLQRNTWEAPEELKDGKLDVTFVNRVPEGEAFISHTLETLYLVIVSPIAWKDRLKNADWPTITSFPWVWAHRRCPLYGISSDLFAQQGREPVKAAIADQELSIRELVTSGAGLSLMIAKEAHDAVPEGKLFVVKENVGTVDLSLVYLRKRADNPPIKAVSEVIQRVWRAPDSSVSASVHTLREKRSA